MAQRPPGWHVCRAALLGYSLAVLPFVLLVFVLLPLLQATFGRLGRRRRDPWWPVTRWMLFVSTLPRAANWIEQRLQGRSVDRPRNAVPRP